VVFDLSSRDNYEQAGRNRCYITIQVFKAVQKIRKVGLKYTQNEMIMLDGWIWFVPKSSPPPTSK